MVLEENISRIIKLIGCLYSDFFNIYCYLFCYNINVRYQFIQIRDGKMYLKAFRTAEYNYFGKIVRYAEKYIMHNHTWHCSQTRARLQVGQTRKFSVCTKPITRKHPRQNSRFWTWKSTKVGGLLRAAGDEPNFAFSESFLLFQF